MLSVNEWESNTGDSVSLRDADRLGGIVPWDGVPVLLACRGDSLCNVVVDAETDHEAVHTAVVDGVLVSGVAEAADVSDAVEVNFVTSAD